jgi:hypothetical protein
MKMKNENSIPSGGNPQMTTAQPRFWLMLMMALLCAAGAALAATALHGKGSFTGHAVLTPLGGNHVSLEINVAGNVTHLGKSTVRIHTLADFSGPVPTPIPPTTGVITAANGDTVSFTLRWAVGEVAPGVFDTVGPFTITGGTGRFRGATGSGDYQGRVDTRNGAVAAKISGDLVR